MFLKAVFVSEELKFVQLMLLVVFLDANNLKAIRPADQNSVDLPQIGVAYAVIEFLLHLLKVGVELLFATLLLINVDYASDVTVPLLFSIGHDEMAPAYCALIL